MTSPIRSILSHIRKDTEILTQLHGTDEYDYAQMAWEGFMEAIVELFPEAPQHIGISTDDFDTLLLAEATTLDSIEDMCYTNIRDNSDADNLDTANAEAIYGHIEDAFTQLRAFRRDMLEKACFNMAKPIRPLVPGSRQDPVKFIDAAMAASDARLKARRER